jgi:hypothetical protein
MPSNLLKKIEDGVSINNDRACAPLTQEAMAAALEVARDEESRVGRATALVPKLLVDLYPNSLSGKKRSFMEGTLPYRQRFNFEQADARINLTPYVTSIQTTKSLSPDNVGTCSIRLKGSLVGRRSLASREGLDDANTTDKAHTDWLQVLEDNDIIVVHLENGLADTRQAFTLDEAGASVASYEFSEGAIGDSAVSEDRYQVGSVGRNKAPMVFFGFIDSVRRVSSSNGLGGKVVEYTIEASDFSKMFSAKVPPFLLEREGVSNLLFQAIGLPTGATCPLDIALAFFLRGLMRSRNISQEDVAAIESGLKDAIKVQISKLDATSAPQAQNALAEIEKETNQLIRISSLITQLATEDEAESLLTSRLRDQISPSTMLMPKSLLKKDSAFPSERIASLAPTASLLANVTGAQLGELLMVHTGYAGRASAEGDPIAVEYADNPKSAAAPRGGVYGIPSYIGALPSNLLASMAADLGEGNSIHDVLADVLGDTLGAVEMHYDLADYYDLSPIDGDDLPVTMPTLFVHSRKRPLTALSDFERNAYLKRDSKRTLGRLWADEHDFSVYEWMNIPVNLISETDIVTESLQRSGQGRKTLVYSSLNPKAQLLAAIATSMENKNFGASTGSPIYYNQAQELVHGHNPAKLQSSGVIDLTATSEDGVIGAHNTSVVFTRHRDDALIEPIELKGTIVVAALMPSARVGQRLAVFRRDRRVPPLEEFLARWEYAQGGLHPEYLDHVPSDEASADLLKYIDALVRQTPELKLSDVSALAGKKLGQVASIDAVYRSWFFAHFDCFVIDEVSHGVDINPQDGTIEATTALVVSLGAQGREFPAIRSPHPAAADTTSSVIAYIDYRKLDEARRFSPSLKTLPKRELPPENQPSEQEIRALAETLRLVAPEDGDFVQRWREGGESAVLFREVDEQAKIVADLERLFAEMSDHFLIGADPTTGEMVNGGRRTNLLSALDMIQSYDPLGKPQKRTFPAQFKKVGYYALIEIADPLWGATKETKMRHLGLERDVYVPQGRISVAILQSSIPSLVSRFESRLNTYFDEYKSAKTQLAAALKKGSK